MNTWDYPMGADTPDAPWNQVEHEPEEVEVTAYCNMIRKTTVETTEYEYEELYDEVDDEDESGRHVRKCHSWLEKDFSSADLDKAYKDDRLTIKDLLDILRDYLKQDLQKEVGLMPKSRIKFTLSELEGWEEDDFYVEQD